MTDPRNTETIHAYTDGSCSMPSRFGGWGFVLLRTESGKRLENHGSSKGTTNNQMELTAAIEALRVLKIRCSSNPIILYTDSQYVKRGLTEWLNGWVANGWRTASKKPVANKELWLELKTLAEGLDVSFEWVKAHNGNALNERADYLANMGTKEAQAH